ncbi:MAG: TatD family deoxyribonuclease [Actinomyces ruminicola]|uniref:TatD DNase family protein n=1 Tax=Actinomyces ruminicola TaxID=332524 RepID=A0A1G9ZPB1_9ACTO|nr:TatD family hydrolase [Actinomyces ruminicola]MBE6481613.1 TatD family deoxyribonuclease [Actinomyces ruminicola]SDN23158.1 TatD DNase family protein [Actinomyces ruminicola]
MSRKHRDRSWPPADAVAPLAGPVTDNHTHLPVPGQAAGPGSDAPLNAAELVERAADVGVTAVITSACETPTWAPSIALARGLPAVRVALAIHPNEAVAHAGVREIGPDGLEPIHLPHHDEPLDEAMSRLEARVRSARDVVVAIGETGMDLFRTGPRGAAVQREAFRAHIALAKQLDLPLQIHDRDAHAECLAVLEADGAPERTVFHCFSGDAALAAACAEHGWYASVAGPITYPANDDLRAALASLPDELLLIETDAPYLPPKRFRGRPNGSYLMPDTLRLLAQQRDLGEAEMCTVLERNTRRVYGTEL